MGKKRKPKRGRKKTNDPKTALLRSLKDLKNRQYLLDEIADKKSKEEKVAILAGHYENYPRIAKLIARNNFKPSELHVSEKNLCKLAAEIVLKELKKVEKENEESIPEPQYFW